MAENIKLKKTFISHKEANKKYGKSFNDIVKTKKNINFNKLKEIYDELFYDIPERTSENSHESLVRDLYNHLYANDASKKESRIDDLNEAIELLNDDLTNLQVPLNQNFLFPNGSFLIAGINGEKYQGMDTIYVMQEGVKRAFGNWEIYLTVREALKLPSSRTFDGDGPIPANIDMIGVYYVSVDELNAIPNGHPIYTGSHLSIVMPQLTAGISEDPIYQRLPFTRINLHCDGVERPDIANLVIYDYYVDNTLGNNCTVTYIKNEFEGDTQEYTIETVSIPPGTAVELEIARDNEDMGLYGIPPEVIHDNYFNYNDNVNEQGFSLKARNWGKDRYHKGVVYATGRIKEKSAGWKLFNAVTEENLQAVFTLTFDDKVGPDNNRRIYKNCRQLDGSYVPQCYGNFDQPSGLQTLFDDPNFIYYHDNVYIQKGAHDCKRTWKPYHKTYNLYGQPILRGGNEYYILLEINYFWNNVFFFNLNTQKVHKVDAPYWGLQGNFDANGATWEGFDTSKLAFPGFQGYATNKLAFAYGQNYFNPTDGGSDFGYSNTMLDILNGNPSSTGTGTTSSPCNYTQSELMNYMVNNGVYPEGCTLQNCLDC